MKARFYNLPFTQTSRDRVLYNNALERDEQFNSYEYIELDVSSNRRLSSNAFEIKVRGIVSDIEKYNYLVYNNYYLFIDSVVEETRDISIIDCTLDVFTQYFLYDDINDDVEVYIERAHFDRFKKVDDKYVIDYDNPDMLTSEPFDVESMVRTDTFNLPTSQNRYWYELILNEHLPGQALGLNLNQTSGLNIIKNDKQTLITTANYSFYVPVLSELNETYTLSTDGYEGIAINFGNINQFLLSPIVGDIRITQIVPFNYTFNESNNEYIIHDSNANIISNGGHNQVFNPRDHNITGVTNCLFGVEQKTSHLEYHYLDFESIFTSFEPKLEQFYQYKISLADSERYIPFDILKNQTGSLSILSTFSSPEQRINVTMDLGLVNGTILSSSFDTSLPNSSDSWEEYKRDRRISLTDGQADRRVRGVISGGALGVVGGMRAGRRLGVKGVIGGAIIGGTIGLTLNERNERLSRADIKNAPNSIISSGTNGAMLLIDENSGIINVEVYEPINSDINHIKNVLFNYGYSIERVDNFKKYLKNRMAFNSITTMTDTDVLNKPLISSHNDYIKTRLNQGMKFWHDMKDVNKKININIERNLVDVDI